MVATETNTDDKFSSSPRRQQYLICATFGIVAICAILHMLFDEYACIKCDIVNNSDYTLKNVHVLVTGRNTRIAEVNKHSTCRIKLDPTGESSLSVTFTDETGRVKGQVAHLYFEPGYVGNITVVVDQKLNTSIYDDITIFPAMPTHSKYWNQTR